MIHQQSSFTVQVHLLKQYFSDCVPIQLDDHPVVRPIDDVRQNDGVRHKSEDVQVGLPKVTAA